MTDRLELTLTTDQDLIPREIPAQRILEIAVQAPDAPAQVGRPALNLALVLDRSGSMSGEKLEYVKQAALHVLDLLQAQDRVALVAYDDDVNLLSPSLPVTPANRAELQRRIRPLETGGSTNLSGGWLAGCQEIAAAAQAGGANIPTNAAQTMLTRALLLTDGQANMGIVDPEELAQHARELAKRGVSTSTFGVGRGFNEHLLEEMANQGQGSFYYIEAPSALPGLFAREFAQLAAVSAKDVEVVLEFPGNVNAEVLGGWRVESSAGQLHIFIGSLNAGRRQELYVKLLTPPHTSEGDVILRATVRARGMNDQSLVVTQTAALHYAARAESEAAPSRKDVLERFAQVDLAHTANEALKLERRGERARASKLLQQSIDANRAHTDAHTQEEYGQLSERMKRGMDEDDRKSTHYETYERKQRRKP
jgi:Ca-activated chloride channel homolog